MGCYFAEGATVSIQAFSDQTPAERLEQVAVPRAAARVLAACATNATLTPDLRLEDALAGEVHERLGGCAQQFSASELRHSALRALAIDQLAMRFFERHPRGLGVGAWSVLGTRAHRLREARWVDIDTPDVAKLRLHLLPERRGWTQVSACLCCSPWADALVGCHRRQHLFVLDESVLPIKGIALMRFLDEVSRVASVGSEVLVAFDREAPLRPVLPLSRSSAAELVLPNECGGQVVRYPRLRFIDAEEYAEDRGHALSGVNAIARFHGGVGHPAIAHLKLV